MNRNLIALVVGVSLMHPVAAQLPVQQSSAGMEQAIRARTAAQAALESEHRRYERALIECRTALAPGMCSEAQTRSHQQSVPVLRNALNSAEQGVRNARAQERSSAQAAAATRRAESAAAKQTERAARSERQARRQQQLTQRLEQQQSVEAQSRRDQSRQRYEAKLARHQQKQAQKQAREQARREAKTRSNAVPPASVAPPS